MYVIVVISRKKILFSCLDLQPGINQATISLAFIHRFGKNYVNVSEGPVPDPRILIQFDDVFGKICTKKKEDFHFDIKNFGLKLVPSGRLTETSTYCKVGDHRY